jgi:hypothetical protein
MTPKAQGVAQLVASRGESRIGAETGAKVNNHAVFEPLRRRFRKVKLIAGLGVAGPSQTNLPCDRVSFGAEGRLLGEEENVGGIRRRDGN